MIYIRVKSNPDSYKEKLKPLPIELVTSGSDQNYDYNEDYVNKILEEKKKLMRQAQAQAVNLHTPSHQYGNASGSGSLHVNNSIIFKKTPSIVAVTPMDESGGAMDEKDIDLNESSDSESSHILEHAQPKVEDQEEEEQKEEEEEEEEEHDDDNAPDIVYMDEKDKKMLEAPMEEENLQEFKRHFKLSVGDIADDIPDVPNSLKSMGSDVFGVGASDDINPFGLPILAQIGNKQESILDDDDVPLPKSLEVYHE